MMKSYNEWQDERPVIVPQQTKKWKATKGQIIQWWKNLRPDTPIVMKPVPYEHKGSTYQQDGIRITGSKDFIASTVARLKEFIGYENPSSKLMLVYRETDRPATAEEKQTYVFYIQSKQRGPSKNPLL